MNDYLNALQLEFEAHANPQIALEQKAYLRDQFLFYGIRTPVRREMQKPFLVKEFLPSKTELENLIKTLWQKPQREFHYFAQELAQKYTENFSKEDILLFEFMVVNNSWWDTIDFIATKLIGPYFKKYPAQRDPITKKWMSSGNIWLQRCCLLFQLLWKERLDVVFLEHIINSLLGSKEFFINKAIGWILRDYSRTDADWVINFVDRTSLEPLSKREALKLLS